MNSAPLSPNAHVPPSSVRVLLVEDQVDAREVYELLLRGRGAHVVAVGSVREARAQLDRALFDVLVSDIGLPEESGYDLINYVRASAAALPAIAITAFGGIEERVRAIEQGFDVFLAKPFRADDLWAAVDSVVRRRPLSSGDERSGDATLQS